MPLKALATLNQKHEGKLSYPINQVKGPQNGIPCNHSPRRCPLNIEKTLTRNGENQKLDLGIDDDDDDDDKRVEVFTHF